MSNTVQDVVGVFDAGGSQLFVGARSIRALVNERSKPALHPLETGGTFGDNVVDLPVEIALEVILRPAAFRATYQEIKAVRRARKLVTVQTKTDTYTDMLLHDLPHDETPEMFDTVAIAVKLTQFQLIAPQYKQLTDAKKPANKSTIKTGQKNAAPATPKQSSAAFDLIFGSH